MSILFLLREHGDLTFEEMFDIMGSSTDEIELMSRLSKLEEAGRIKSYMNDDDLTTYSIIEGADQG
jgi:hypothetical protein